MTTKRILFSKLWLWLLIVAIAFSVWGFTFYCISLPPSKKTVQIWIGSDSWLTDSVKNDVTLLCVQYGMEKCSFGQYNPADGMYTQAFATRASSTDLFVLSKEEALKIAYLDLFVPLEDIPNALTYEGKSIGVSVDDDMYLLVCSYSHKNDQLMLAIVQYFLQK